MRTSPLNALVERLESVEALDGLGRTAGRTVRGLISDGVPKGVLSGAWLGHALHPIMTDIPIGAWTSSVLLDWTGGKESRSAADRLILTGVLAAGATVATGWSDWADVEQRDAAVRRSGLVHAAANATATALMMGSYVARKRGARGPGRLLSLAGSAALGVVGWLGGHLSYTLGAGVTAGALAAGVQATAATGPPKRRRRETRTYEQLGAVGGTYLGMPTTSPLHSADVLEVPQPSEPATPAVPEAPVSPAVPDPGTPADPEEPADVPTPEEPATPIVPEEPGTQSSIQPGRVRALRGEIPVARRTAGRFPVREGGDV